MQGLEYYLASYTDYDKHQDQRHDNYTKSDYELGRLIEGRLSNIEGKIDIISVLVIGLVGTLLAQWVKKRFF